MYIGYIYIYVYCIYEQGFLKNPPLCWTRLTQLPFFLKDVGLGLAKLLRRRPRFQRGGRGEFLLTTNSAKAKAQSAEL